MMTKGLYTGINGAGKKRRRHHRMRGKGIFSDIWSGIKSVAGYAAPVVIGAATKGLLGLGRRRAVHRRRVMGRGVGPTTAIMLHKRGFGRRYAHRRRKRGGSLLSQLRATVKYGLPYLNNKLKQGQYISRGLNSIGLSSLGNMASSIGYGKRRYAHRRRRGGAVNRSAVLSRLNSLALNPLQRLHHTVKARRYISRGLHSAGFHTPAFVASALGYGKRRRVRRRLR